MLPITDISLKPYHSFASQETTRFFTTIKTNQDIEAISDWNKQNKLPLLIIGSGTNVLFTKKFEGLVAKMEILGVKKIAETASEVFLEVGAGENWHHFVSYCVQKGWGGIENLSLIPGTVGASPIQNIGAYGVEVQECIQYINAFDTLTSEWVKIANRNCSFGYRSSLFKQNPSRYIIAQVQFVLQKQPQLKTDYGVIREVLHDKGIKNPSLENISSAIIQIRSQKLPDPKVLGNAGSFFKNPTVPIEQFETLKEKFPAMIAYPISDTAYKIAAGWLIEACGWKGVRKGNVGCFENQALVIVSYGIVSGKEVFDFSEEIIKSVNDKFEIILEREVNVL
jgi:UDP-N-acetylmuramate dehydrogenase